MIFQANAFQTKPACKPCKANGSWYCQNWCVKRDKTEERTEKLTDKWGV